MFPRSFPGLQAASFKVAFDASFVDKMRFLVELGFAGRETLVGETSPRAMLLALAARQEVPANAEPADADWHGCEDVDHGHNAGEFAECRHAGVVKREGAGRTIEDRKEAEVREDRDAEPGE